MATGDIVAQTVIDGRTLNNLEYGRVARFGAIGTCLVVRNMFQVLSETWYSRLNATIDSHIFFILYLTGSYSV